MMSQYLPLTEYSSKYKVSISTLRRRIKAEEIKYVFEEGKYMILDEKPSGHQGQHRPSQAKSPLATSQTRPSQVSAGTPVNKMAKSTKPLSTVSTDAVTLAPRTMASPPPDSLLAAEEWNEEFRNFDAKDRQEPILSAANRLLTELKKAYTQILQEKEEQILSLKEEVSDLKTLVRVLEAENARKQLK